MEIIFATNNQNKVVEIKSVVDEKIKILSLKEAGIEIEIEEPFDSFEENALEKARVIFNLTKKSCFSEDTGLEVEALNGEPGVKSARYADGENQYVDNIDKLLQKLKNEENRNAQFKTIICFKSENESKYFEGICKGRIIGERKGNSGFGYDPVFIPDGSDKTFAEMNLDEKNKFSHRKKAVEKLVHFLNEKYE